MPTQVKICGLKTADALDAALVGGADYVGFVFCATSPRNIDVEAASRLADRARQKADVVALMVDPSDAFLLTVMKTVAPDYVQLHGSESLKRVAEIRKLVDRPIIKAIGISEKGDALAGLRYAAVADTILFDAKPPKHATRPGGHGMAFDWSLLDEATTHSNWPSDIRWMLSGGLTSENVGNAVRAASSPVVDVSSGVESAPGVKDPDLIRRFIAAAKTSKQA